MNILLFATGIALIALATYDALKTTISFSGGGPLTLPLATGIWSFALGIHRAGRSDSRKLLKLAGPVILLTTVLLWISMVFAGYAMMFGSHCDSIISSTTRLPTDFAEKLYFTAYTLFTLDMGDFIPNGHGWQMATSIASLHGLSLSHSGANAKVHRSDGSFRN
ncbi:hypothetical protein [Haloferula sp.]|uniref:hypothetical protein n=1 Tax=Haloferula sp. TaxID=2497595 RepID=UPI003C72FB75